MIRQSSGEAAWESIARHAVRHGRSARYFDAMDLYLEGYRTGRVMFYVLTFSDQRGIRYWTGGDGTSHDPDDAEVYVSMQEAIQEEEFIVGPSSSHAWRIRTVVR